MFDDYLGEPDPKAGVSMVLGSSRMRLEQAHMECLEGQYIREVYDNSKEAQATRIQMGPDWVHARFCRENGMKMTFRYSVEDNGIGMSADELVAFFRGLHVSSKTLGIFENFGHGVKVSLLPLTKAGLIVKSWQNYQGYMIWIRFDETRQEYILHTWEDENGDPTPVKATPSRYDLITEEFDKKNAGKPRKHGTILIALGDSPECDSWKGFPDQKRGYRYDSKYLNRRIWEIPVGVTVSCWENPKGDDPEVWWQARLSGNRPSGRTGGQSRYPRGLAPNILPSNLSRNGKAGTSGAKGTYDKVEIGGEYPATIHCYTYEDASTIKGASSYKHGTKFIGILYQGENYEMGDRYTTDSRFKQFGVAFGDAQARTAIVIEPHGTYICTDGSRARLTLTQKSGTVLPWREWGRTFTKQHPDALRALLKEIVPHSDTLEDAQKAIEADLRDRFKGVFDRWGPPDPVNPGRFRKYLCGLCAHVLKWPEVKGVTGDYCPCTQPGCTGTMKRVIPVKTLPDPNKPHNNKRQKGLGPLRPPKVVTDTSTKEPDFPAVYEAGTVYLNFHHPFFTDLIGELAGSYLHIPDVQEFIGGKVSFVWGRALASRVMNVRIRGSEQGWSSEQVRAMVTPEAMTFACLDCIELVASVKQQLGGLGVTRQAG